VALRFPQQSKIWLRLRTTANPANISERNAAFTRQQGRKGASAG